MITKGYKELLEEANDLVEALTMEQVLADDSGDLILVDIRDPRELDREGMIPDAFHAPRGMLEFWVDPDCKYHHEVFAQDDKTFVLYCASAWRSALSAKTLIDMGMTNVKHLKGGFGGWKKNGGPVGERPKKKK